MNILFDLTGRTTLVYVEALTVTVTGTGLAAWCPVPLGVTLNSEKFPLFITFKGVPSGVSHELR